MFPRRYRSNIRHIPTLEPVPAPGYTTHRLLWGSSVWTFMHTLAAKLDPDRYLEIRASLWEVICGICRNLPCPECSAHADAYLKTIRIESLQTAEEFERMLIVFHNVVNSRKLVPLFPEEGAHEIYASKPWNPVLAAFIDTYNKSHEPMLQMFQTAHRRTLLASYLNWLHQNEHLFQLRMHPI